MVSHEKTMVVRTDYFEQAEFVSQLIIVGSIYD